MSASFTPTCGPPGSVSSIFTEITGDVGTPPMPVNGFFGAGFGGGGVVDADVVGAGLDGGGVEVFLDLLSPLQAALARRAVTASDAATTRSGRCGVIGNPLPSGPAGQRVRRPGRPAWCRRCRRTAASRVAPPSGKVGAGAGRGAPGCRGPHHCRSVARSARGRLSPGVPRRCRAGVARSGRRAHGRPGRPRSPPPRGQDRRPGGGGRWGGPLTRWPAG